MKNLKDMKVVELKGLCKENGLKVSGNKSELIERLQEILVEEVTEAVVVETVEKTNDLDISRLEKNTKLKINSTTANFVRTEGQMNAIRALIYNYKIKVSASNVTTRSKTSETISNLYNAIKSGKVQRRTNRYSNQKIELVDGYYTLVAK